MQIAVGFQPRGNYRSVATMFVVVAGLPLIPLHGVEVTSTGAIRRAPMRLASVGLAYLRVWGVLLAGILTWLANKRLAFGEPGGWTACTAAIAVVVATLGSWFLGRRLPLRWALGGFTVVAAIALGGVYYFTVRVASEYSEFRAREERLCKAGNVSSCEELRR